MKKLLIFCAVFLSAPILNAQAETKSEPVRVVTSINVLSQPLAQVFADEIAAGDLVIEPLMQIGSDPHLYVPTRADLAKILASDVVVFMGLGLEAQFGDVLRRVGSDTTILFVGDSVLRTDLIGAGCDPVQDLSCYVDPHIWMDPAIFGKALTAGVQALGEALGADEAEIALAVGEVDQMVADADTAVRRHLVESQVTKPMITAHDAFAYFSAAYGIETLGLAGISTDVEPSVRRVSELADRIVEDQIPAVFLESSVPPRGVQSLIEAAQAQGQDVVIRGPLFTDSLGAKGSGADTWVGMLEQNSLKIACAIGAQPPAECGQ